MLCPTVRDCARSAPILLNVRYLPVARTAALFKDLFQLPVSTGWVSSLGQKTSLLLADTVVLIKQAVFAKKISGCLQSTAGAEHFVSIRSVISTARKPAVNEFEVLLDAFTGNSWIPSRA